MRHCLDAVSRAILPSGTSSNEALHSQVNFLDQNHSFLAPKYLEAHALWKAVDSSCGLVLSLRQADYGIRPFGQKPC